MKTTHSKRKQPSKDPLKAYIKDQKLGEKIEQKLSKFELLDRANIMQKTERKLRGLELLRLGRKSLASRNRVMDTLLRDPKFHIMNDRAFNAQLFNFLKSPKAKQGFSFAIVDMDFLKKLNALSHITGDASLQAYIEAIRKEITGGKFKTMVQEVQQSGGKIGRFGGDELQIVFPGTAEELAEKLDKAKETLNKTKLLLPKGLKALGFSAGVIQVHSNTAQPTGQFVEQMKDKASQTTNVSKKRGRNKVTILTVIGKRKRYLSISNR